VPEAGPGGVSLVTQRQVVDQECFVIGLDEQSRRPRFGRLQLPGKSRG
jgi:hypothetical protein